MFSKDGILIKEFDSLAQGAKEINLSYQLISYCCENKYGHKTAGGYKWEYIN